MYMIVYEVTSSVNSQSFGSIDDMLSASCKYYKCTEAYDCLVLHLYAYVYY